MWLLSPRAVIANMIVAHGLRGGVRAYAQRQRSRHLDSGHRDGRRAAPRRGRPSRTESGSSIRSSRRIVRTWPVNFDPAFGRSLGMQADPDFDSIVRQYIADEL
jgi:hypothetical protein